jgi:mono/diheme cytochrome c family protein
MRRRTFWVVAVVAVAFAAVLTSATADAQRRGGDPKLAARKNPVPATAASILAGRTVYNMNCRQCHGLRLKGDGPIAPKNPKPADLSDDKWDHGSSDGEIFAVIWNGAPAPKSEMKPMKGTLTEKNVWEVINFIRSVGAAGGQAKPGAKPSPTPVKKAPG